MGATVLGVNEIPASPLNVTVAPCWKLLPFTVKLEIVCPWVPDVGEIEEIVGEPVAGRQPDRSIFPLAALLSTSSRARTSRYRTAPKLG